MFRQAVTVGALIVTIRRTLSLMCKVPTYKFTAFLVRSEKPALVGCLVGRLESNAADGIRGLLNSQCLPYDCSEPGIQGALQMNEVETHVQDSFRRCPTAQVQLALHRASQRSECQGGHFYVTLLHG